MRFLHFHIAKKNQSGFSLLEIMFAFLILTIGIVSVLALLTVTIRISRKSPNELIAIMLADEALTTIQNIRDTNLIRIANGDPITWNEGITVNPDCSAPTICILGYDANSSNCYNDCNSDLKYACIFPVPKLFTITTEVRKIVRMRPTDLRKKYFQIRGGVACLEHETIFKRTITIFPDSGGNPDHIRPSVTVTWNDGTPRTITLTSDLYNY